INTTAPEASTDMPARPGRRDSWGPRFFTTTSWLPKTSSTCKAMRCDALRKITTGPVLPTNSPPPPATADATPGQAGDFGRGGETGHEDQAGDLGVVQLCVGRQDALLDGLFEDARQVQPGAVVAELDRYVVAFVAQVHRDRAGRRLAGGHAQLRRFDAVGGAVAQQMLERRGHAVEHAA